MYWVLPFSKLYQVCWIHCFYNCPSAIVNLHTDTETLTSSFSTIALSMRTCESSCILISSLLISKRFKSSLLMKSCTEYQQTFKNYKMNFSIYIDYFIYLNHFKDLILKYQNYNFFYINNVKNPYCISLISEWFNNAVELIIKCFNLNLILINM